MERTITLVRTYNGDALYAAWDLETASTVAKNRLGIEPGAWMPRDGRNPTLWDEPDGNYVLEALPMVDR